MPPVKTNRGFRQCEADASPLLFAEALIVGLLLVAIVVAGLTLISVAGGA